MHRDSGFLAPEMNTNTKTAKFRQTTVRKAGRTEILYRRSWGFEPAVCGRRALRAITGRANYRQKVTQTTAQRDVETEI